MASALMEIGEGECGWVNDTEPSGRMDCTSPESLEEFGDKNTVSATRGEQQASQRQERWSQG